jgi:hypothetical protein
LSFIASPFSRLSSGDYERTERPLSNSAFFRLPAPSNEFKMYGKPDWAGRIAFPAHDAATTSSTETGRNYASPQVNGNALSRSDLNGQAESERFDLTICFPEVEMKNKPSVSTSVTVEKRRRAFIKRRWRILR